MLPLSSRGTCYLPFIHKQRAGPFSDPARWQLLADFLSTFLTLLTFVFVYITMPIWMIPDLSMS